jgi:hypothetical protein
MKAEKEDETSACMDVVNRKKSGKSKRDGHGKEEKGKMRTPKRRREDEEKRRGT